MLNKHVTWVFCFAAAHNFVKALLQDPTSVNGLLKTYESWYTLPIRIAGLRAETFAPYLGLDKVRCHSTPRIRRNNLWESWPYTRLMETYTQGCLNLRFLLTGVFFEFSKKCQQPLHNRSKKLNLAIWASFPPSFLPNG